MSEEDFNMSLRKFLKTVGVTSQREIEEAVRKAGSSSGTVPVRMMLSIEELGLEHEVTGEITLPGDA
ncbi:DUF6494 family protein [Marimonas arenosa]|uniref:DUF6494 family protein n=1 Tax=Marimonas arenosa TaxID=1795305 RepID=A0AAE3WGC2_9RHOB|nr:DUF6494 family protein [Marimonas arenosa]MDQ2091138.1 DUF6494 family protein [Marimonas arenosa]